MKINIRLNHVFQPYAEDREKVGVTGSTIGECLDNLIELYPVFKELLFDDEGILSVLIIYDRETIVPSEINQPVAGQNEILIFPMVQGG